MRLFTMLFVLLSLAVSGGYLTDTAIASEQNLIVFYSNDVAGETEPCG